MKVVILAGGFGTRLSEYTQSIPKPLVSIGELPIIHHIMNHYSKYGYNDFIIALGYKSSSIKRYFLDLLSLRSDFTIDFSTGKSLPISSSYLDWKVTLVDTGLNTMTGGRVKRIKHLLDNQDFFLTYGDGLSNVDLDQLLNFHKSCSSCLTLTAVRPPSRFGDLIIDGSYVTSFREKSQIHEGWINGGFFVVNPSFIDLIDDDSVMLEREPIELACSRNSVAAFKHEGFWQCMDSKRDLEFLQKIWESGNAPWVIK